MSDSPEFRKSELGKNDHLEAVVDLRHKMCVLPEIWLLDGAGRHAWTMLFLLFSEARTVSADPSVFVPPSDGLVGVPSLSK